MLQLGFLWLAVMSPLRAVRSGKVEHRMSDHGADADLMPVTRAAVRGAVNGAGIVTLSSKTPDAAVHPFRDNLDADTLARLESDPGQVQYLPEDPGKTARLAGRHGRPMVPVGMGVFAWMGTILWLAAAAPARRRRLAEGR